MGNKLEEFYSRGVKIAQDIEGKCRIYITKNQVKIYNIIQLPAVWRAGNYCVHHKIVPNSEYISANESKPNPGERYDAVDYSQRKKF